MMRVVDLLILMVLISIIFRSGRDDDFVPYRNRF
jgi:hypothetical protein